MCDLRETVLTRGEGDDVNLSSFEVKMKPKLQTVSALRRVVSCQCLCIKAG